MSYDENRISDLIDGGLYKQQTEEQNKMIAEWIGLRRDQYTDGSHWWYVDLNNTGSIYHNKWELHFSDDLNWLHPVVQKLSGIVHDSMSGYSTFCKLPIPTIFDDISAIYEWCVKVIQWINQSKTS